MKECSLPLEFTFLCLDSMVSSLGTTTLSIILSAILIIFSFTAQILYKWWRDGRWEQP